MRRMTLSNATRRLAMLVVLSFALRHSMHGQTTTTNTDCTINGNTANCTSTSTDDSAERKAQAEAQAERDRRSEELGKSMGNAFGAGIGAMARVHNFHKQVNQYCKQHPGETWTWGNNDTGEVYESGQCKGEKQYTPTVSKEPTSGDPCSRLPAGANGCKDGKTVEAYAAKKLDAATQAIIDERDGRAAHDQALKNCVSTKFQAWRAEQPAALPKGTVPPVDLFAACDDGPPKPVASTIPQSAPAVAPTVSQEQIRAAAEQKEKQEQAWGACAHAKWLTWRSQYPNGPPRGSRDPTIQFYEQCKAGQ